MDKPLDLSGWTTREACGLCGADAANIPMHAHHKQFRSQGGGDSAGNLVRLCIVCHDAVHGIPSVYRDHSCETCPVLRRHGCHFGEKLTQGRATTPKPW